MEMCDRNPLICEVKFPPQITFIILPNVEKVRSNIKVVSVRHSLKTPVTLSKRAANDAARAESGQSFSKQLSASETMMLRRVLTFYSEDVSKFKENTDFTYQV